MNKTFRSSDWPINDGEVLAALKAAFASGDWGRYHGVECEGFSRELAEYHEIQHALLCSSGTIAVELALRGLGVTCADEVILAGYDFPGNFRAIEAIGARPVLVDLESNRWTLSVDSLEEAMTAQTKAVIVSHLHGDIAPIREIADTCKRSGIGLLEDACQVVGAEIGKRRAGTIGDVGVLSFGGSKLITAGRGGAVLTNSDEIAQRVRINNERGNEAYPLSELQAAVLRPQLSKLDARNHNRWRNVQTLWSKLEDLPLGKTSDVFADDVLPAFFKLGWFVSSPSPSENSRDCLVASLKQLGVPVGAGFRGFFRRSSRRCRSVGKLENSKIAADSTLLLNHADLLGDDGHILELAKTIRKATGLLTHS
ncbi:MAG: aminotransferase class V-fold PLP-dependent enzyme [Planctomycetaceae bacterium]|nr:aminotransferase class V-fold PLP-dependent enzyme [Planctomycetaceae bacterium]